MLQVGGTVSLMIRASGNTLSALWIKQLLRSTVDKKQGLQGLCASGVSCFVGRWKRLLSLLVVLLLLSIEA